MARPTKNGLDYFPLNCVLNDKFDLIEAEFGLIGFAIIIKLLQKIYRDQGYYCEWNDDVALLFAKKNELSLDNLSDIVNSALNRGIFDSTLYQNFNILTSKGIQKRYIEATQRRKSVLMKREYYLLKSDLVNDNDDNNLINVIINSKKANNNPQSKVKESKVNKSKVNKSKIKESRVEESNNSYRSTLSPYGKFKNVLLSENELYKLKEEYPNEYDAKIDRLSIYMESSGATYKNHFAKLIEWLEADSKKTVDNFSNSSYDISELEKIDFLDDY